MKTDNVRYIYALHDPRNDAVRYIGKTKNLRLRLQCHIASPCNPKMEAWIDELRAAGLRPKIRKVETVNTFNWQAREIAQIAEHRSRGADLLNVKSGGGGERVFTEAEEAARRAKKDKAKIHSMIGELIGRPPSNELHELFSYRAFDEVKKHFPQETVLAYFKENRSQFTTRTMRLLGITVWYPQI